MGTARLTRLIQRCTAWVPLRAVLLTALVAGACRPDDPTGTRGPTETALLVRVDLSGTAVATIVVDVTAPDIAPPLVFNIPIAGGIATGTITVPSGSSRTITIRAFDAGGVETHSGSATINVRPGVNPSVAIILTPLVGNLPINATLGSFSVTVQPARDSVYIGDTLSVTATVLDANGTPVAGEVVWASLSPGVASVVTTGPQAGRVTAVRPGAATVVAVYAGTAGPATVVVAGWFAAPTGQSTGDGSRLPWDLQTALNGANGKVLPGDTIWLRGGTYSGAALTSTVHGAAGAPVVVRQYPGERAILDANGATPTNLRGDYLVVTGDYVTLWGLEVMDSDPNRSTETRPNLVVAKASHLKFINMIVHDGGIAFYSWPEPVDLEFYGCVIYNNGWQQPDFGDGHGLYIKSYAGPIFLRENILFNQFGYGIHIFTEHGSGGLTNIHVEGNVSFNNGSIDTDPVGSPNANILFGGSEPVINGTLVGNMTYFSPNVGVHNLLLGFSKTDNQDLAIRNNYIVGGPLLMDVGWWQSLTMTDNTLLGTTSDMIWLRDSTLSGYQLTGNRYYRDSTSDSWGWIATDYHFPTWQQLVGVAAGDQVMTTLPTEPKVFVRPNQYERGRANVIIYNWSGQASVPVDLAGIVRVGDHVEVRNVQNLFAAPVVSVTYDGSPVSVPMTGVTPAAPIGGSPTPPPQTGPAFGTFLVTSSAP